MKILKLNKDEIEALMKLYNEGKSLAAKSAILFFVVALFVGILPIRLFQKIRNVHLSENNLFEYFGMPKYLIIVILTTIIAYLIILAENNIFNLRKDTKSLTKLSKRDEVIDYHEHSNGRSITLKGKNPKVIHFSTENYIELYKEDLIDFEVYTNSEELIRIDIVENIL